MSLETSHKSPVFPCRREAMASDGNVRYAHAVYIFEVFPNDMHFPFLILTFYLVALFKVVSSPSSTVAKQHLTWQQSLLLRGYFWLTNFQYLDRIKADLYSRVNAYMDTALCLYSAFILCAFHHVFGELMDTCQFEQSNWKPWGLCGCYYPICRRNSKK